MELVTTTSNGPIGPDPRELRSPSTFSVPRSNSNSMRRSASLNSNLRRQLGRNLPRPMSVTESVVGGGNEKVHWILGDTAGGQRGGQVKVRREEAPPQPDRLARSSESGASLDSASREEERRKKGNYTQL